MVWKEKTWEWDLWWCAVLDMVYASLVEREALGKGEVKNNVQKIVQNWINAKWRSLDLL